MGPSRNNTTNIPLTWAEYQKKREEERLRLAELEAQRNDPASNVGRVPTDGMTIDSASNVGRVPTDDGSQGLWAGAFPDEEINPNSPLANVLIGPQVDLNHVPELPAPRDVRSIPAVAVVEGEPRVDPVQTALVAPPEAPEMQPSVSAAPDAEPEEQGFLHRLWGGLGADTDEKRQKLGSSLMRAGAAMMGHTSNNGDVWSALGAGMTAGVEGYDQADEASRQRKLEDEKLSIVAKSRQANDEIAKIMRENPNWQSDPVMRSRIASLMAANGDIDAATRVTNGGARSGQTADMQEYSFYVDQENAAGRAPMSFGDWQVKKSGGSSKAPDVQRNLDRINSERAAAGQQPMTLEEYENLQNRRASDTKFAEKSGEENAKTFAEYQKAGIQSNVDMGNIDTLETALTNTPGGFANLVITEANNWGFGDMVSNGAGSVAVAEAMINKLVPAQRPPGSGAMSDADLDLFKRSLPRLQNSTTGNQLIIETMRGIAGYNQNVGAIASRAMSGEITQSEALELMRAVPDPMASFKSRWAQLNGDNSEGNVRSQNAPRSSSRREGQTGTTSDGRRVVWQNGKWKPAQ